VQVSFTGNVTYPNFIVRLLDENYKVVSGLEHQAAYAAYPKASAGDIGEVRPHFAEEYFWKKLENDPAGVQNYLLLATAYLRSQDFDPAIKVLRKGLEMYPKNPLLNYELIMTYQEKGNRTETLRQLEKLRELSADLPVFYMYDFDQLYENEEFQKAEQLIDKLAAFIGDDHEKIHQMRVQLMAARQENEKLVKAINLGYRKFKYNPFFIRLWYLVQKNMTNNVSYASNILENFLLERYNSGLCDLLINEKKSVGEMKDALRWIKKSIFISPDDYGPKGMLINYYYNKKDYDEALDVVQELFELNPYRSGIWVDKGRIYEAMGEEDEAIRAYKRALQINPNLFSERAKLRELEGKGSIYDYFEKKNVYPEISRALEAPLDENYNFEYVFYEENYVVYPGGAYNKYGTLCARIFNQSGLDYWKESGVGYRNNEDLNIDKAEVVKKNGEKIRAEIKGNKIVFPSLEVGDAIYLVYKIDGYALGRLSNEFWYEWFANSFTPIRHSVFRLMMPKDLAPQIVVKNLENDYKQEAVEDFVKYEWVIDNPEVLKDEPYMPAFSELAKQVQVSTVESWDEIAEWYHYVGLSSAEEDIFVEDAYNAIFGENSYEKPVEKARAIYDYLCTNIRYSYVDFRQSGQIPQIPSQTITTQLGDCKDLATLYHVLAKKAGLETHLVLVTTRDNGEQNMLLPTDQFNHAIIAIDLPEGRLFQELTDSKLPFGAMPNSNVNAQALVIPNNGELEQQNDLINLPEHGWIKPVDHNTVSVSIEGTKLVVNNRMHAVGSEASIYRNYLAGLTQDREKEEVTGLMGRHFSNPIELDDYQIKNLNANSGTFSIDARFYVTGGVLKLGGMYAFKVPYLAKIVDSKTFALTDRKWPFTYWNYESADEYVTEVSINLPEGVEITEMPANLTIQNDLMDYQLSFEAVSGNQIEVRRKVRTNRSTIPASEYDRLKALAQQILEAEEQHIVFR
jgi:tetratricopeptide (TPR) repeat protein